MAWSDVILLLGSITRNRHNCTRNAISITMHTYIYMYVHDIHVCVYVKKHCHGGARQASDRWTAVASSLLAFIHQHGITITCLDPPLYTQGEYIHVHVQLHICMYMYKKNFNPHPSSQGKCPIHSMFVCLPQVVLDPTTFSVLGWSFTSWATRQLSWPSSNLPYKSTQSKARQVSQLSISCMCSWMSRDLRKRQSNTTKPKSQGRHFQTMGVKPTTSYTTS